MPNFQHIISWLELPALEGEEAVRQGSLINLIFKWGVLFLISTLLIWPLFADSPNALSYLYISLALLLGLVVVKQILNRGWVRQAGYLLAAMLWVTFCIAALLSPDGLASTPFWAAVTITPILAGFINGTNASIIVTLLNWGMGGYIMWLDLTDPLRNVAYYEAPLFRYLALMVMASVFPVIVFIWQRNLQDALNHVRLSEQAEAETAAYRLQNEALEAAVTARTSALEESLTREQQMAEKLTLALESETQLGELQSRIITVVSHEFRTPLSVINSSAELLRKFYDRLPEDRREAAHTRIRESIFYLNDLLKDVTLVDQAQRATIRPSYQTFTFSDLCQELVRRLLMEVSDPNRVRCHFAQGVDVPVQTDINLLQQIAANLISNGLKYSDRDSFVEVHFRLDSTQLFVEVIDQGIGIPQHEQSRIYELFYRASNVDERRGLGLGLFIVQLITKLLQGSVHLQSGGEGQGATFEVRLPLLPQLTNGGG
ncbi:sensor histidine kinase [Candidatus Leptofilum sp.]|uniref:sensor histidine kinase n=1 Tax=Candidatus Leptofilum sp. TaxID=3241576 RepID=UPI003B5C61D3